MPGSKRATALACALVALLGAVPTACRSSITERSKEERASSVRLAQPFPIQPFESTDLDGGRVAIADWKGQVIVVNVWATWCAPCRRELPMLSSLQSRYLNRVRVLGLLQDTVTDDFARTFLKTNGVSFPVVRANFDIESRLPAVMVIPMTFVINKEGELVSSFAGEADPGELEKEILALLKSR